MTGSAEWEALTACANAELDYDHAAAHRYAERWARIVDPDTEDNE